MDEKRVHQDSRWIRTFKYRRAIVIAAILLAASGVSNAFDGARKGFVAGAGVGIAPRAHWSSSLLNINASEFGVGGELILGYAWDNRNMLVYDGAGCLFTTSQLVHGTTVQGIDAVRWYHYWGKGPRQFFTALGVGSTMFATQYCGVDGSGFGYSLGVGRELFKQVQAGVYLLGGRTSNDYGLKASHLDVLVLLTIIAY
ncbi:MAG TPA: hypothetical protein VMS71_07570 [Candidatus Acidoferrum sp.]|nr:hypothetical protein [Candidatus Acidoferrum sp.]